MPSSKEKRRDQDNSRRLRRQTAWIEENGPCVKCGSDEGLKVKYINPILGKQVSKVWSLNAYARDAELRQCHVICDECVGAPHGTHARYSRQGKPCRCGPCKAAHSAYVGERYRATH